MRADRKQITVEGRRIPVSNLDKTLYPGEKFTKGKVIDYYIRISKFLLPHLKDRPVTLKRFPDGVFGEAFYEKDAPAFTPEWVKTVSVPRREIQGLVWHDLRATFGMRLGEAGFDAFTIMALMGHRNVRTTQRYVRATERNKREAVQAAMLSSRGHNLATRVNAITQNHAVA
ncbi:MAG TPA: tyrosine-type recombinase/integrase [Pyrinomonadaceae bacterium]|jgi:integrase